VAYKTHSENKKTCSKCRVTKPLSEFYQSTRYKSGYVSPCKECACEIVKVGQRKRRREFRDVVLTHKSNIPCPDCKQSYPSCVMDFDHRPGETKAFEISQMLGKVSMETLEAEIAKCDIVCANCHRIRTHRRKLEKELEACFA
jgi:hypothetical protein